MRKNVSVLLSSISCAAFLAATGPTTPVLASVTTDDWQYITDHGIFSNPIGIAVDSTGGLYVTNFGSAIDERPSGSITWQNISNGASFNNPDGITVDRDGNLFVSSAANNQIEERLSGSQSWTDITGTGSFSTPVGIGVDANGDVFVANASVAPSGNGGLIEERSSGSTTWEVIPTGGMNCIPNAIAVDSKGDLFVLGSNNGFSVWELPSGTTSWQNITNGATFNQPAGIAVDSQGDLFITNYGSNSIEERPSGSTNWIDMTAGSKTWQTLTNDGAYPPRGITVDSAGDVYVAFLHSVGELLAAPTAPTGITVTKTPSSITLAWNSVLNASRYDVYENGTNIAANLTSPTYTITGLTPGSSNTFTVSAVNSAGESPQSSPLIASTLGLKPIQLSASDTHVTSGQEVTVYGTVYDVYGAALNNATVNLSSTGGTWSGSNSTVESVYTDASGAFSGTWIAPNVSSLTQATVSASVYDTPSSKLSLNVEPSPTVGATSDAVVGTPYTLTLNVQGGFLPYTWSVKSGNLPAGMSLDSGTGMISGTPTTAGSNNFTVQAKDAYGHIATQNLSILVTGPSSTSGTGSSSASGNAGGSSSSGSSSSGSSSSGSSSSGSSSSGSSGGGTSGGGTSSSGTGSSGSSRSGTSSSGSSSSGSSSSGSSGGGTSSSTTTGSSDSAVSPVLRTVLTTHLFDATGGAVYKKVGAATIRVSVPQGAFTTPEEVTVTSGTASDVTALAKGLPTGSVATVLGVNFSGATPIKPLTVTVTNPSIPAGGVMYKLTSSGQLVPVNATVSNGTAVVSFTSDPDFVVLDVKPNERVMTFAGHANIVPAIVSKDAGTETTYMPIWYVMQMLRELNIQTTWDGHNWHLTTTLLNTFQHVMAATGDMHIYVNGTLVQNVHGLAGTDPSTGNTTTFMPIWYVQQVLTRLGVQNMWNGMTWSLTQQGK